MNTELANRYFQAWNDRDADAILATLGADGTYEDPGTGGPISGEALRGYVGGLWAAFPDLEFEIESLAETGPASAAGQWIMRGTNSGPMRGLPPTGESVEVRGADFFGFGDGHIKSVLGYFDGGAVPRQIGLQVTVQPYQVGPFHFGTSTVVQTGKTDIPGAFSITHLEARDEAAIQKVREGSRDSIIDMMKMDEFIGATTATSGSRMVTISAWKNADGPRRVMREGAHAEAMKALYDGSLASAGRTSVWTLLRDNGVMLRCDACGKMARSPKPGDTCACGTELPEAPPFW